MTDQSIPVPRLMRATIRSPVGAIPAPSQAFLASYTPEGGLLPPIFVPQVDLTAAPGVTELFGSADAPYTILRLARERPELKVVNDQHGRPTYAPDLAAALWKLIACDARGTVHCANEGAATWFDVAKAAIEIGTPYDGRAVHDCRDAPPGPKAGVQRAGLHTLPEHRRVAAPVVAAGAETINVLTAR